MRDLKSDDVHAYFTHQKQALMFISFLLLTYTHTHTILLPDSLACSASREPSTLCCRKRIRFLRAHRARMAAQEQEEAARVRG